MSYKIKSILEYGSHADVETRVIVLTALAGPIGAGIGVLADFNKNILGITQLFILICLYIVWLLGVRAEAAIASLAGLHLLTVFLWSFPFAARDKLRRSRGGIKILNVVFFSFCCAFGGVSGWSSAFVDGLFGASYMFSFDSSVWYREFTNRPLLSAMLFVSILIAFFQILYVSLKPISIPE